MTTTDVLNYSDIPDSLSGREIIPDVVGTTMGFRDFLVNRVHTQKVEISFQKGRLILEAEEPVLDWYVPVCRDLINLLDLPPNWDSYDAPPIQAQSVVRALHFLENAFELNVPQPSVVPTISGGVQLEWHANGIDLEIELAPYIHGSIFYEDQEGNLIEREGDLREEISLLRRLIGNLKEN